MEITKRREKREGLQDCWRIYYDGKPTKLFIEKAIERPTWGSGQQYDLCHNTTGFLTEGSVRSLMQVISDVKKAGD